MSVNSTKDPVHARSRKAWLCVWVYGLEAVELCGRVPCTYRKVVTVRWE